MLLFGARAGRDGGRGRGGGAGLLLKVCYDNRHVAYGDSQLLGGAPVDVLQFGPVAHRQRRREEKSQPLITKMSEQQHGGALPALWGRLH